MKYYNEASKASDKLLAFSFYWLRVTDSDIVSQIRNKIISVTGCNLIKNIKKNIVLSVKWKKNM